MSKENAKMFLEQMEADPDLKVKFIQLSRNHQERIAKRIIELGREVGLEFTSDDIKAYERETLKEAYENGAISKEQLQAIAGENLFTE